MREWIGTGVSLLGLVVIVAAVVEIVRSRASRPSELSRLSPAARREVLRRIRSCSPVGDAEACAVARDMAARRALFGVCGGLLAVECGQFVLASGWSWALLHAVAIGMIAAGTVLLYRDFRRARRFVELHRNGPPSTPTAE